jgi:hypothetical protein
MVNTNANLGALSFNPQNMVSPPTSGGTLGFSLGTGATQVLPYEPQIQRVTFHNPGGAVIIYVCQATDSNGNALAPGPNGGSFAIYPGGDRVFTGNGAAGPWLAAAASGSGNPLTVATSQTP